MFTEQFEKTAKAKEGWLAGDSPKVHFSPEKIVKHLGKNKTAYLAGAAALGSAATAYGINKKKENK